MAGWRDSDARTQAAGAPHLPLLASLARAKLQTSPTLPPRRFHKGPCRLLESLQARACRIHDTQVMFFLVKSHRSGKYSPA